jgi:hypothetical protein
MEEFFIKNLQREYKQKLCKNVEFLFKNLQRDIM